MDILLTGPPLLNISLLYSITVTVLTADFFQRIWETQHLLSRQSSQIICSVLS